MKLSTAFSIDPGETWVIKHNAEARAVLDAYRADRPIRVPLLCRDSYSRHGFYADEIGLDYRQYYSDPETMLRVQLEASRRRREVPFYDFVLGELPDSWWASVDLARAVTPGWLGCSAVCQEHALLAYKGLSLNREECERLEMPDPLEGGLLSVVMRFWKHLRDRYEWKLTFLGRPVGPIEHGVGTNGLFSLALDVRGSELMSDMYEAAEFAHSFLAKIADWCDALEKAWAGLESRDPGPFMISDHGIDMLSAAMYDSFVVPEVLAINGRRGTPPPTSLHHCGRGTHLFPVIRERFGLTYIEALTYPLVDIAKVRHDLGDDIWISALIDESIVQQGPTERIRETVKELMSSGVKRSGRFAIMIGDMTPGTPPAHRLALYEAVKEFGRY